MVINRELTGTDCLLSLHCSLMKSKHVPTVRLEITERIAWLRCLSHAEILCSQRRRGIAWDFFEIRHNPCVL